MSSYYLLYDVMHLARTYQMVADLGSPVLVSEVLDSARKRVPGLSEAQYTEIALDVLMMVEMHRQAKEGIGALSANLA